MMQLSDLRTAAVNEIFNNGGTVNDFITPTMANRWANMAQYTLWQNLVMNDISYFGFYDRSLVLPGNLSNPAILTLPEDVHSIVSLAYSANSSPGNDRMEVPPMNDPRERSYIVSNNLPTGESNPGFAWQEGPTVVIAGSPKTYARQIILTPAPTVSGFLFYDGQRLPIEMVADTDIPDAPRDCHDFIVWEMVLRADLRDKVFRQEIFKKRDMSLKDIVATHKKGVQRQRTIRVTRLRWS